MDGFGAGCFEQLRVESSLRKCYAFPAGLSRLSRVLGLRCKIRGGGGHGAHSIAGLAGTADIHFSMLSKAFGLQILHSHFFPSLLSSPLLSQDSTFLFCVLLFFHARAACAFSTLNKCIPHSYDYGRGTVVI